MPTVLDRLQYGFDRDGLRTWRRCTLTTSEDNFYGYDGLGQVVTSARGNLNLDQTAIAAVPAGNEAWDYDPIGNWKGYTVEANGAATLDQSRVHDKGNRLTQCLNGAQPPSSDPAFLLDRTGRMTQMSPDASGDWSQSLKLKWDAWSRITEVRHASDDVVLGTYAYDGMTRRTKRVVGAATVHSYYSDAWRPLEERKDGATTASAQYLWGARHRDDLVRRDRDAAGGGTLNETRYVLMDYFSPASITDGAGAVKERYAFSAFGVRRILAPDFSARETSECDFEFGFQGQIHDGESGLCDYGYRYYSPELGRWTAKDPIGEFGGVNLYGMVGNDVVNGVDYLGLDPMRPFPGNPAPPSPGTPTPNTGGAGNGNCVGAACGTGQNHQPTDQDLNNLADSPGKFLSNYNPMGDRGTCKLVRGASLETNYNPMEATPCGVCEREVICVAFHHANEKAEIHCIGRDIPGLPQVVAPPFDSKEGWEGNNVTGITDPLGHFGQQLPPADKIKKYAQAIYCCKDKK